VCSVRAVKACGVACVCGCACVVNECIAQNQVATITVRYVSARQSEVVKAGARDAMRQRDSRHSKRRARAAACGAANEPLRCRACLHASAVDNGACDAVQRVDSVAQQRAAAAYRRRTCNARLVRRRARAFFHGVRVAASAQRSAAVVTQPARKAIQAPRARRVAARCALPITVYGTVGM